MGKRFSLCNVTLLLGHNVFMKSASLNVDYTRGLCYMHLAFVCLLKKKREVFIGYIDGYILWSFCVLYLLACQVRIMLLRLCDVC